MFLQHLLAGFVENCCLTEYVNVTGYQYVPSKSESHATVVYTTMMNAWILLLKCHTTSWPISHGVK